MENMESLLDTTTTTTEEGEFIEDGVEFLHPNEYIYDDDEMMNDPLIKSEKVEEEENFSLITIRDEIISKINVEIDLFNRNCQKFLALVADFESQTKGIVREISLLFAHLCHTHLYSRARNSREVVEMYVDIYTNHLRAKVKYILEYSQRMERFLRECALLLKIMLYNSCISSRDLLRMVNVPAFGTAISEHVIDTGGLQLILNRVYTVKEKYQYIMSASIYRLDIDFLIKFFADDSRDGGREG